MDLALAFRARRTELQADNSIVTNCEPFYLSYCRIVLASVWLLLLTACAYQPPETFSEFEMTGEVVRLDAATRHAVVRHDDIRSREGKLWMGAMTMEFPVRQPAEFALLRVGIRIRARVVQRDSDLTYWIEEIRELPTRGSAAN